MKTAELTNNCLLYYYAMRLASITILFFVQWLLCGIAHVFICVVDCVHSFPTTTTSQHHDARWRTNPSQHPSHHWLDALQNSIGDEDTTNIDISGINEAQMLLACRAWLLRKHKIEWNEKKRRADAAASPLNNEGYFWPDPNDLLYLREEPDPYNLNYNETYGEYYGYKRNGVRFLTSQDTTYSGKNYLVDEEIHPQVEERASTSTNPFSTNPLNPSDEHIRRSNAKMKLWNNETWKQQWYNSRWEGRVATESQKLEDKQNKLLRTIPMDVIESESFDEMSEENVTSAIITYLVGNQRKSTSRKSNKDKRQIELNSFREWREQVKKEACNSAGKSEDTTMTMFELQRKLNKALELAGIDLMSSSKDIGSKVTHSATSNNNELSFSPSATKMEKIKKIRSDKSKRAFQTRLANSKVNTSSSSSSSMKNITKFYTDNEPEVGDHVSPVTAILQIDAALDHNRLPSPIDVETILKSGRLGRRRDTLRRILSECFDLRGKCVPGDETDLQFVTNCPIQDLGEFVLTKLNERQTL